MTSQARRTNRHPAVRQNPVQWSNRGHFFTAAAETIRRILVDDERRRGRLKRGGGRQPSATTEDPEVLALALLAAGKRIAELQGRSHQQRPPPSAPSGKVPIYT